MITKTLLIKHYSNLTDSSFSLQITLDVPKVIYFIL